MATTLAAVRCLVACLCLGSAAVLSDGGSSKFDACGLEDYYRGILSSNSPELRQSLHATISARHVVVPYTSTATDVWDAMAVLDRDPTNYSNVVLIYSRRSEPFATHGVASGWNREHIWPKSFGVGYSGSGHL